MELFYGGGGRSNPDFVHRFWVKSVPDVMWAWLEDYPLTGPFERWYIQNNYNHIGTEVHPLVQIESSKAAYLFKIAYSEYIIEDLTYSFAKQQLDRRFE
jgi:hypothetical protein